MITKPEIAGDIFFIKLKDREYRCQAFKVNDRMLYQVKLNDKCIYVTKTINQHRIYFWTSIPQEVRLRAIVFEIGRQIEDHLIKQLCVTTTT